MNTSGYVPAAAFRSSLQDFSTDTIQRMCLVRDAYKAGLISRSKAALWAYRITCHMRYNASDPQDRLAFAFITSGGRFA